MSAVRDPFNTAADDATAATARLHLLALAVPAAASVFVMLARNSLAVFNRSVSHPSVRNFPWAAVLLVLWFLMSEETSHRSFPSSVARVVLLFACSLAVNFDIQKWALLAGDGFVFARRNNALVRFDEECGNDVPSNAHYDFWTTLTLLFAEHRSRRFWESNAVQCALFVADISVTTVVLSVPSEDSITALEYILITLRVLRLIPPLTLTTSMPRESRELTDAESETTSLISRDNVNTGRPRPMLRNAPAGVPRPLSISSLHSGGRSVESFDVYFDAQEFVDGGSLAGDSSGVGVAVVDSNTRPTSATGEPISSAAYTAPPVFPDSRAVGFLRVGIVAIGVCAIEPRIFATLLHSPSRRMLHGTDANFADTIREIACLCACVGVVGYIERCWSLVKGGWMEAGVERIRDTFFAGQR
ncbi:hypothetical protein HDU83_005311 [Entophlyctis luteolus]|nr:hypothetical protein HDU83_005311 [Entophlyctis luteolus]